MSFRIDPTKNSALAFLLGAALVGGVLGFTADRYVTRDHMCPRWGDEAAMRRRFADELGLSDAQRASVDTILNAKHRAIAELDKPIRPQMDSISDAATRGIRARLDPSQQATFDRIHAEVQARKRADDQAAQK
jgi:hypothetical protein